MKSDITRIAKSFVLVYIPIVLAVVVISWMVYHFQYVRTRQEILYASEKNIVDLQKTFAQYLIKSVVADINIIADDLNLSHLNLNEATLNEEDASNIVKNFFSFSRYKGIYDQVRILDTSGMERIRVDLRADTPILIPRSKLQFKGNRYYFTDTIKLNKGEIYMSPLDLNIENGEIEHPFKPMLRFGQVLWDRHGNKQGVLILNYLGENLISGLEKISYQSPGQMLLANAQGFWLKAGNPENEWGFMLPKRRDATIRQMYPTLWQTVSKQDGGQVLTTDGLFTFQKIYLLEDSIRSGSGSGLPAGENRCVLTGKECYWTIFSHVPPRLLNRQSINFVKALIIGDLIFLVLVGFLAWEMIKANIRRREAEAALRESNQNLEKKVIQRTRELKEINQALITEMEEHKKAVQKQLKISAQLKQAQKMEAIGTLAGGIAHDFNNLLTPILGFSEMIKMDLSPASPIVEDIGEIEKAASRAKKLVQQILTFSRQTEQELKPLKIQLIVKEALKLLRSSIPSSITIKEKIRMDCGPVMADPTNIHQIIMNLCTNAYHSMRSKGGVLTIFLAEAEINGTVENEFALPPGRYVRFDICDTGQGISREVVDKIFEPYFTTKKKGEGTGLGLSVVHSIVQNLNGHIFVESRPGQTCFKKFLNCGPT